MGHFDQATEISALTIFTITILQVIHNPEHNYYPLCNKKSQTDA